MTGELINSKEALALLSLTNYRCLKWLADRGLLTRVALGPRTFRYYRNECAALPELARTKGISLTLRP